MKLKAAKSVALSSNSDTLKIVLTAHLIVVSTYKQHHSKTETESALLSRDSNTIKPLITLYAYR